MSLYDWSILWLSQDNCTPCELRIAEEYTSKEMRWQFMGSCRWDIRIEKADEDAKMIKGWLLFVESLKRQRVWCHWWWQTIYEVCGSGEGSPIRCWHESMKQRHADEKWQGRVWIRFMLKWGSPTKMWKIIKHDWIILISQGADTERGPNITMN